jgi:hypothetical protein
VAVSVVLAVVAGCAGEKSSTSTPKATVDRTLPTTAPSAAPATAPATAAAAVKPGHPEPATVTMCAAAPTIDGDLADPCWKDAQVKGAWVDVYNGKSPAAVTEAFITYDAANVYVAFRCTEPMMKSVVAANTERDGSVWEDDSVELFLDPSAGKREYYQLIVNPAGTLYDGIGHDSSWNADAKVVAKKLADGWAAEFAIPLKDLQATVPAKGQTWKANFCRNRLVTGNAEAYAWSDTGEAFHNPDAFGKLMMK